MMYRQGDVLIKPIKGKVAGNVVPRDNGRVILAYGEVTGHAHAIKDMSATLFDNNGVTLLNADSEVEIVHEEHDTVKLPKGLYEVVRQREFDAGEIRVVAD